ncbi:DUF4199 domain-containing protein [Algoriphagus kandeliae]|uniref:DUF4199 domain-containing protein n=1 Tax=Algoriphagus kandeliae TaxID=2562278 RepID=A0A4Y9QUA9_9BACT|nr:DUF4199 domain-containing protein [Algoriphagus kandeliae]TFV96194.1 DUF4199 domain-containing protein [Algoriphagus kandeliae]
MKNLRIEIKWAIVFLVMTLLWMMFEKSMGWHDEAIADHASYTNLYAIPAIMVYVLALLDKKKNFYGGQMTYKQGFMTGLIITLIVAILSPLNQYIISTFITPEYFTNVIEYSVSNGMMEQTEAEAYFSLKNYMLISVIGALMMGLITTLVVALFVRSRK